MTATMDSSRLTLVMSDNAAFLNRIKAMNRSMNPKSCERLRNKCSVQFATRRPGNDDERMVIYTEVREKFVKNSLLPL